MLNKKKLNDYKKVLQTRLGELLDEADRAVKNISETNADTSSDPTDQAVQELDRNRLLRFKDRERKLIRKIEKALVRIEDGSYGGCESCGAPISDARLKARPMTTLCIDCATEMESEKAKSRLFGGEVGEEAGSGEEDDEAAEGA
ncbi:MAG: zinc finger transcriptional regulator, TraR/DksA family [Bacteriovoracaceae bacterium]|nr:zinc finger transcriptional regulator, TraR/DksA family [Bacteriovoracaceae bacterium]